MKRSKFFAARRFRMHSQPRWHWRLALLLADDLAALLFPWIMLPVLLAELSLSLWMIIKGVNMQQWQQSCEN